MQFKNLLLQHRDGILQITVNRPDKLNALNFETLEEIRGAFELATEDQTVKAILLTGSGEKAFVAGADINEFLTVNEINARGFAENGQEIFAKIENCPKPVLAAINGYALGGGCELALACHMRVAADHAKMGLPEVTLGILPGYGGTQRLTQLVGKGKALELIMTGDMISAADAEKLGMVNYSVPMSELLAKAEAILRKIMLRAPVAIGQVVECVNAVYDESLNGYEREANSFAICAHTEDFREGTKAFLEKRQAVFKGK